MDPEGTRNRTNVFELPVNVSERSEDLSPMLCDNHLYPGAIAGITVGCVAAFLLGAAIACWRCTSDRKERLLALASSRWTRELRSMMRLIRKLVERKLYERWNVESVDSCYPIMPG